MRGKNTIEYLQSIETYRWDPGKTGQKVDSSKLEVASLKLQAQSRESNKQFEYSLSLPK